MKHSFPQQIAEQMAKIKTSGAAMPRMEEDLVKKRREELRHAQDVREHYERKLARANNLYMELSTVMLQLESRERDLLKYVEDTYVGRTEKKNCSFQSNTGQQSHTVGQDQEYRSQTKKVTNQRPD